MGTCSLDLLEKLPFQGTAPDLFLVTPVKVYREEIERPVRIYAKIDTGFTRNLLIGDVFGRRLRDFFNIPPDEINQPLWALGVFGVPCDVYYLNLQLPSMTNWVRVRAYFPQGIPYAGNIVGMELLKWTNLCIRGPEQAVRYAKKQTNEISA